MNQRLSPPEIKGIEFLCGQNARMREVINEIIRRQWGSVEWNRRADKSLSGGPSRTPYLSPILPICVESARGSRITDVDGNEYIDCHMANCATIVGHNPPEIIQAVRERWDRGPGAGQFLKEQVELAELICDIVPGAERVAFFHTGGEAIHASVRLAKAAMGRKLVAKFEGCYHGWGEIGVYNTMMSLSGKVPRGPLDRIEPDPNTGGVSKAFGSELIILPYNDPIAFKGIRDHAADLACVVVDPVPPFMAPWIDEARAFVTELRSVATETGVPLIFDEVVSGFRLALGGAQELFDVTADMACYGKITSGLGIPLSVVAGKRRFLDKASTDGLFADYRAGKAWISSTHNSNFVAIAAALTAMRFVTKHFGQMAFQLDDHRTRLDEELLGFAQDSGIPVKIQGHPRLQSMISLGHLVPASYTYRAIMGSASPWHYRILLALTFYLRLEGIYMQVMPTMNLSFAHTEEDVERIATALKKCLTQMQRDGIISPP